MQPIATDRIEWSVCHNYDPVLWQRWLGHLTRKTRPDMTYNVFSWTLSPTQSVNLQKWLNRSRCCLGYGLRWVQGSMFQMGVHNARFSRPCVAAMGPFCPVTFATCYCYYYCGVYMQIMRPSHLLVVSSVWDSLVIRASQTSGTDEANSTSCPYGDQRLSTGNHVYVRNWDEAIHLWHLQNSGNI